MTLPSSCFADAKRVLSHFRDAEVIGKSTGPETDKSYVEYRLPLYGVAPVAPGYLIYAALQSQFGSGMIQSNDDDLVISLPTSAAANGFPVHQLEQGLHRVRKALLSALEQGPDGHYIINKQRMNIPGVAHIDLEDLANALVASYDTRRGIKADHAIEARYALPEHTVYIDADNMRHKGEVSQQVYANYLAEKQQNGSFQVPFMQAESKLKIDGHVLTALYRELGVEMSAGRAN